MATFQDIDQYISTFPDATQTLLQALRSTIREVAPEATEAISYDMPTFKLDGKNLVHFAGYENHIGFYALPTAHESFRDELAQYKTGKGSVQFPIDQPLPLSLIRRMVEFRVKELQAGKR
jgi:uncharacterized protein YdhG (YjbR/CyaY superfamily)